MFRACDFGTILCPDPDIGLLFGYHWAVFWSQFSDYILEQVLPAAHEVRVLKIRDTWLVQALPLFETIRIRLLIEGLKTSSVHVLRHNFLTESDPIMKSHHFTFLAKPTDDVVRAAVVDNVVQLVRERERDLNLQGALELVDRLLTFADIGLSDTFVRGKTGLEVLNFLEIDHVSVWQLY